MSGQPADDGAGDQAGAPSADDAPPPKPRIRIDGETVRAYLRLLDFGAIPDTKLGWAIRASVVVLSVAVLWQRVQIATAPMLRAKQPAPIASADIEGYRFRLPEEKRREIFEQLATAELAERERAISKNTWAGHLWSREDDRGHYERVAARSVAAKYRVSLSQVYLVLDEGLRNHWPAPNGEPLPATTPPLSIRSNSW
jgi:hypothetical protein